MRGRGLEREEATLERLAQAPGGRALTAIYLVGAYWPWWLTLGGIAAIAWRLLDVAAAGWAAGALLALAAVGGAAKVALERWRGPPSS